MLYLLLSAISCLLSIPCPWELTPLIPNWLAVDIVIGSIALMGCGLYFFNLKTDCWKHHYAYRLSCKSTSADSKDLCSEHSKAVIPASSVLSLPFSFIWVFLSSSRPPQQLGEWKDVLCWSSSTSAAQMTSAFTADLVQPELHRCAVQICTYYSVQTQ